MPPIPVPRNHYEQGAAMVVVLVLAVALTLLVGGMLTMSQNDRQISANDVRSSVAFNAAEGGLEHAVAELPNQDIDSLLVGGGRLFSNRSLGDAAYSVMIANNIAPSFPTGLVPADPAGPSSDSDGYLVVTSTGTLNKAKHEVSVIVQGTSGSAAPWGVYGANQIALSGGMIDSFDSGGGPYDPLDPGSNCPVRSNGEIDVGSTMVYGDATAGGIVKNPENVSGTVTEGAPSLLYPTVACPSGGYTPAASVPTGPGITYTASTGVLKLSSNANLTLIPGEYYFQEISADTNATLNVGNGSGHLDIYLDRKLNFTGHSQLNPNGASTDLTVWGCGSATISMAIRDGDANHLVVYAPRARFDMSSSTQLYGSVLAQEFKMSGNSSFHCDQLNGSSGGVKYSMVKGTWTELQN